MKASFVSLLLALLVLVSCAPNGEPETGSKDQETMPIVVVVQLSPDVARAIHEGDSSDAAETLQALLDDMNVAMNPMHPNTRDPLLIPYFTVDVSDRAKAEQVVAELNELPFVEGAYIKPPDALP